MKVEKYRYIRGTLWKPKCDVAKVICKLCRRQNFTDKQLQMLQDAGMKIKGWIK